MKIWRGKYALIAFGTFVGLCGLADAGVTPSNCKVTTEEQAIYAAVLKFAPRSEGVTVVERITDRSHFMAEPRLRDYIWKDLAPDLAAQLERAPNGASVFLKAGSNPVIPEREVQELEEDYRSVWRRSCEIPSLGPSDPKVAWISSVSVRAMFPGGGDPKDGWANFEKQFGAGAETVSFSRVAFDKHRRYAFVQVSGLVSGAGGGTLYLLQNVQGCWVVSRAYDTWTT